MKKIIIKKDIENCKNTIIKTKQGDNIQRTGVLTLNQEKMLLERSGKLLAKSITKNVKEIDNEITEQKKLKEAIDIFDEKRKLDKNIEENKIKMKKLKEEQKRYINMLEEQEKYINIPEEQKNNKKE